MTNPTEPEALALLKEIYNNFKILPGKPRGKYVVENEYRNYRKHIEPKIKRLLEK